MLNLPRNLSPTSEDFQICNRVQLGLLRVVNIECIFNYPITITEGIFNEQSMEA